ncbi:MAG: hypothetical protein MUC96_10945 [Myxococcaceae bacterium]|nr:hypothetical protein [Myxococcaceae bacterium]
MRAAPASLFTGLALGFALASFPACPGPAVCTPTSCPTGCCDASGRCQLPGNLACGTRGATCATCAANESCLAGVCSPSGGGAGPAGGGGGTGGGSAGSYGAFLSSFASAYCQKAVECGGLPANVQADCAALFRVYVANVGLTPSARASTTERSIARGASTFDAARAQACLAQLTGVACDSVGLSADFTACREVTRPNASASAACFSTGDCVDERLSCNGATCGRTCTAGGNLGEACTSSGRCNDPFECIRGLCQPSPAPGSACTSSVDCGVRATCTQGRCVSLPGPGQACPNFQCVPEAFCDSTRVCRAKRASGAACTRNTECVEPLRCGAGLCTARLPAGSSCVNFDDCVETAPCRSGLCTPPGAVGAPCDPLRPGCSDELLCDDVVRTCQPVTRVMTGGACSSARQCTNGNDACRNLVVVTDGGASRAGTCGPPQVGDPCTSNSECGDAKYCDMTTRRCAAAGAGTPCTFTTQCRSTDYCTSSRVCATRAAAGQVCDGTSSSQSCAVNSERCLPTSTPGQFRCQRVPAIGEACPAGVCQPFSACSNGTCVAVGRQGQPCVEEFPVGCLTGECVRPDGGLRGFGDGPATCQPPRANGQPCTNDLGCQSGFCDRITSVFSSAVGVCATACP